MNPPLVAAAVGVIAGGVVAVGARDARVAIAGFAAAGVLAPLVALPAASPLALAARIVGALLAAYLLWVAGRGDRRTRGSVIGWPADALVALACAIAAAAAVAGGDPAGGIALDRSEPAGTGPVAEPLMAGVALAALAAGPLLVGRDAFRLAIGLLLGILAATLIRTGAAGTPSPLEQLLTAGWIASVAGAAALVASSAVRVGGGLEILAGRPPAAHPGGPTAPAPTFRLPRWKGAGARPPVSASRRGAAPDAPTAPPSPASPPAAPPKVPPAAREPGPDDAPAPVAPRSAGARRLPRR